MDINGSKTSKMVYEKWFRKHYVWGGNFEKRDEYP